MINPNNIVIFKIGREGVFSDDFNFKLQRLMVAKRYFSYLESAYNNNLIIHLSLG